MNERSGTDFSIKALIERAQERLQNARRSVTPQTIASDIETTFGRLPYARSAIEQMASHMLAEARRKTTHKRRTG